MHGRLDRTMLRARTPSERGFAGCPSHAKHTLGRDTRAACSAQGRRLRDRCWSGCEHAAGAPTAFPRGRRGGGVAIRAYLSHLPCPLPGGEGQLPRIHCGEVAGSWTGTPRLRHACLWVPVHDPAASRRCTPGSGPSLLMAASSLALPWLQTVKDGQGRLIPSIRGGLIDQVAQTLLEAHFDQLHAPMPLFEVRSRSARAPSHHSVMFGCRSLTSRMKRCHHGSLVKSRVE